MNKITVGIVGASGYSGVELIKLLLSHPQVDLNIVTSRNYIGQNLSDILPSLVGNDLSFTKFDAQQLTSCDAVFFATPTGIAMQHAPLLLSKGVKIIDLSADFRLQDISVWEKYYQQKHLCPDIVPTAVYGLTEVNYTTIKDANLIANPGCYPTAIILGLCPLLANSLIDLQDIIADTKSGLSGAGKKLEQEYLFCQANENVNAYNIGVHRHTPEILQSMQHITRQNAGIHFTPHLVPMNRGMHATLYTKLKDQHQDINAIYRSFYADKKFITILPQNVTAHTRDVYMTNNCLISVHQLGQRVIICSVIDNLLKGAAGQAVQNMNVMFSLEEQSGLLK